MFSRIEKDEVGDDRTLPMSLHGGFWHEVGRIGCPGKKVDVPVLQGTDGCVS